MHEFLQNEVTGLCQSLIRIQSHSGHEQEIASYLQNYMLLHGFDTATIDTYGNVIGCIRGNRPGKCILFDGHLDTVPVENQDAWTHDPFAADIEDGLLYGRGATDMKGAISGFISAVTDFIRTHGRDFAGQIYIAGTVHEECFEGISARMVSKIAQPDLVIIGESSEGNLKISQRGRAELRLETFGKPCHTSTPEHGVNAVLKMVKLIEALSALPVKTHPDMAGDGIMVLTDIKSAPYPSTSVVPEYCCATYDRRLLVGETRENVLQPIQQVIAKLQAEDPDFHATVCFTEGEAQCYTGATISADRFFPGWLLSKDHPDVQAIYQEIKSMGFHPELTGYRFCTNGSHYAGEAGIPCIGIGPSKESLAHTIDEYLPLQELYDITDYYLCVLRALMR